MDDSSQEKIRVRFFTKVKQYAVPDAPFAVPSRLGRSGLSQVVNHLLGNEDDDSQVPFDFLINEELLRSSISKYLHQHPSISTENILLIEFMPATVVSESTQSKETDSWVSRLIAIQNGKLICSGLCDGRIQLHSTDFKAHGSIAAHEQPIRSIAALSSSDDSFTLATGSRDMSVKLWTVAGTESSKATFTQTHLISGHSNSVEGLDWWTDGGQRQILLSGDWNGNLLAWLIPERGVDTDAPKRKKSKLSDRTGSTSNVSLSEITRPLFTIRAHSQGISGVQTIASSESSVFTCSWDHSLKKFDLETQDCVMTYAASKVFTSIHVNHMRNIAASSHPDGKVRLWDTRQQVEVQCKGSYGSLQDRQWISQVRWHPSSEHTFSSCDFSGAVRVWDDRAAAPLGTVNSHDGKAFCLDWMNTTKQDDSTNRVLGSIVSGGDDSCLKSFTIE